MSAQYWKNKLDLKPHPEGGFFKEVFRSTYPIMGTDNRFLGKSRVAGTSIYYLLEAKHFSSFHRIKSDEIWHYYVGESPVAIYVIDGAGLLNNYILGNSLKTEGASFQIVVHAGCWFAAEVLDKISFALVGCTVSPGFEFQDFELADQQTLVTTYPQHTQLIQRLTRKHT